MRSLLFTLLTLGIALSAEPIIDPAAHTEQPINAIRKIFYQIPFVNRARETLGLEPVINLSIGQPHISMQMEVIDPFIAYLESLKRKTPEELSFEMGYSHSAGTLETREWISRFFTQSFPEVAGGFKSEEVMVANGATGAMTNVLNVLLDEGDEVAVLAPYFAAYENQVKCCGGHLIAIPLVLNRSRAEELGEYLRAHPRVKAFIWNDPNNPLGTKATEQELRELAQVLERYPNLVVIHDEIYRDIVHEGQPLSLLNVAPELKARSFVIRSLAKDILGAPGMRAGMIAAPTRMQTRSGQRANFIELMSNAQLRDITSVSVFVQKILCLALEQKLSGASKPWEEAMRAEYTENTSLFVEALAKLGLRPLVMPKGAFYVMVDASPLLGKKVPDKVGLLENIQAKVGLELQSDVDIATFFLHAAGVAMVPGSGFGTDHCSLRVSCARSKEQLLKATQRMQQAMESLGN